MPDLLGRIASKFEIIDGCWIWAAYRLPGGYGMVRGKTGILLAHRAVYELVVEPIRDDLTLDHLCRNRACVNPDHLEPVTLRENIQRGETGVHNRSKTHCLQGHEFSEANTYLSTRRGRAQR